MTNFKFHVSVRLCGCRRSSVKYIYREIWYCSHQNATDATVVHFVAPAFRYWALYGCALETWQYFSFGCCRWEKMPLSLSLVNHYHLCTRRISDGQFKGFISRPGWFSGYRIVSDGYAVNQFSLQRVGDARKCNYQMYVKAMRCRFFKLVWIIMFGWFIRLFLLFLYWKAFATAERIRGMHRKCMPVD